MKFPIEDSWTNSKVGLRWEFSPEITAWLDEMNIRYHFGADNTWNHPHIVIPKKSDAVLFKLKWF
jgi:hypothetical protein